ncbi:MAG: hypothetical protein AAGC88_08570, partial [Bacteroidota bacterium]
PSLEKDSLDQLKETTDLKLIVESDSPDFKRQEANFSRPDSIQTIKKILTVDQHSSLTEPNLTSLVSTNSNGNQPQDEYDQIKVSNPVLRKTQRFSITSEVQFRSGLNQRFNRTDDQPSNYYSHQIQIPLGIRYDLIKGDRRFKPHLYTGLTSVFGFPVENTGSNYDLRFESTLNLDYRIFSTKDGKRGYLRFRLPLFNKSLFNTNTYQPWLLNQRTSN